MNVFLSSFCIKGIWREKNHLFTEGALVHYLWSGSHSPLLSYVTNQFLPVTVQHAQPLLSQRQSQGRDSGELQEAGTGEDKTKGLVGLQAECCLSKYNAVLSQVASGLLAA